MYEPNEDQRKWARTQLDEASYPKPTSDAVISLLDVWWRQAHSEESRELTLDAFQKLARGFALAIASDPDEVWEQAKPGFISRGDQVRVRADAYRGPAGQAHNGRRGRVVGVRRGDVIVKYEDGKYPPNDGVHHSPHSLEKRIR